MIRPVNKAEPRGWRAARRQPAAVAATAVAVAVTGGGGGGRSRYWNSVQDIPPVHWNRV